MDRLLSLLVLLWQLTVLPSVCHAGVLEHRCPDDASASCSHEEGCESDPCRTSAIAKGGSSGYSARTWTPLCVVAPVPMRWLGSSPTSSLRCRMPGHPMALGAPARQRALPLLI